MKGIVKMRQQQNTNHAEINFWKTKTRFSY